MKLSFFGAARAVTGSCHGIEVNGNRLLIDCGLQQGRDEFNNAAFPFNAGEIDYAVATHAHIDHSGRLPLLVREGFRGPIICTRLTARLLGIMLRDSAHIQESDAAWENQKGKRAGRPPVEPLYTLADAEAALDLIHPVEYGIDYTVCEGVRLNFADAGHLLGSAIVQLWLTEGNETKKIVFSGDLGNVDQPIIRNPAYIDEADYVVTESTYGDRNHSPVASYTEGLAKVIDEAMSAGGNVIIPSFAVGRTQELLYFIREIKERHLVSSNPNFDVYVDSPLAGEATKIYSGDLRGYLDEEALELVQHGEHLFTFPGLHLTQSSMESRALNEDAQPKVIISASGMCDAGRIRHHLKHNLWRKECTIVFVGYQAVGSFGRLLLDGAPVVRLFGEEIKVQAKVIKFDGLSSHADRDHLIRWVTNFTPKPKQVFVVHGDENVTEIFAQTLRDLSLSAHAPDPGEIYDLATNRILEHGTLPVRKKPVSLSLSIAYQTLEAAGERLMAVIRQNKGGANKDLKKFTDQIEKLIAQWKR